ncbi:Ycf3-interacting protein 1, chloroplastic [Glycine soja]|uniref:Ycf3-interacting protein 1, chloroplastic n=1 Tax=Glycine soja TaxID=3848 RepID=A0A445GGC3_GLYSO|nr:Ycf3-interacting protein 1, chloroplastic [Glycine soja]
MIDKNVKLRTNATDVAAIAFMHRSWGSNLVPSVTVDAVPKKKPSKSLYAKATDTGIDPELAAKKLNIDWDSAAEIEETNADDETEVPSVVGYGALYLVSAFPIIIGISVVLILFYNSLQ